MSRLYSLYSVLFLLAVGFVVAMPVTRFGATYAPFTDSDTISGTVKAGNFAPQCTTFLNADIYMVIDHTASVNSAGALDDEQAAGKILLNAFKVAADPPSVAVGTIGGATQAATVHGLSKTESPAPYGDDDLVSDADLYAAVDAATDPGTAGGSGTHLGAALNTALPVLLGDGSDNDIVIFISDGADSGATDAARKSALDAADAAKLAGAKIYSVHFGDDPAGIDGQEMMAAIASGNVPASTLASPFNAQGHLPGSSPNSPGENSDGDFYFEAPNAASLQTIFGQIANTLCEAGDTPEQADLDVNLENDSPSVGGAEDLNPATGFRSTILYHLRNEGPSNISDVVFSGTIGGTVIGANRTSGTSSLAGPAAGSWTCTSVTTTTWSCHGPLNNDSSVDIGLALVGTSSATAGQTVIYTPAFAADGSNCTGPIGPLANGCQSLVVSDSNADGTNLNVSDTDFLGTTTTADLDVVILNDTPVGEDLTPPGYDSKITYRLSNEGPGNFTTVTFPGTFSGTATRTSANFLITGTGTGWTCGTITTGTAPGTNGTWSCTGALSAGQSVDVTFTISAAGGTGGQTVIYTVTAPTCAGVTPCTDSSFTNGNQDGSDLTPGPDTDTLDSSADLDVSVFADSPVVGGNAEDLGPAGGFRSNITYRLHNDGPTNLTTVTFSGTFSGTATLSSVANSLPSGWTCPTFTTAGWTCSGSVNNAIDRDISFSVVGTGSAGQTIVYTPVFPADGSACAGATGSQADGCRDLVISDANSDGSALNVPDTDTLDNPANLDVTILNHSPNVGGAEDLDASGRGAAGFRSTVTYRLHNGGPANLTSVNFTGTIASTNGATGAVTRTGASAGTLPAGWTCVAFASPWSSWSCTGPLNNGADADISFAVIGTATGGGGSVTFTPTFPADGSACVGATGSNPDGCRSGVTSDANSDGSTLNVAETDTLESTANLDATIGSHNPSVGGAEDLVPSAFKSSVRYHLVNSGLTTITVTYAGTITGTATRSASPAPVDGAFNCGAANATINSFSCAGSLAAAASIDLDMAVTGTGTPGQTIIWTPTTFTCTGTTGTLPDGCQNLIVSDANTDGSDLAPVEIDTLGGQADLDVTISSDSPAAGTPGASPVEDLDATGGFTSKISYTVTNTGAGSADLTTVNFNGTFGGTATRTAISAGVTGAGGITCSAIISPFTSWSCSGALNAGASNVISFSVTGTGSAGGTITYTPTFAADGSACVGASGADPDGCRTGVVSDANSDGSTLTQADTDTLTGITVLNLSTADPPAVDCTAVSTLVQTTPSAANVTVNRDGTPQVWIGLAADGLTSLPAGNYTVTLHRSGGNTIDVTVEIGICNTSGSGTFTPKGSTMQTNFGSGATIGVPITVTVGTLDSTHLIAVRITNNTGGSSSSDNFIVINDGTSFLTAPSDLSP